MKRLIANALLRLADKLTRAAWLLSPFDHIENKPKWFGKLKEPFML